MINHFGLVLIGSSLLSVSAGILGIFLNLQKKSLVGDALSHSCLPGIVLLYLFQDYSYDSWSIISMFLGAFLSAIFFLFLIFIIRKYLVRIKYDSILAFLLSSFFGLGQVLIRYAQNNKPHVSIARLEQLFLGQISLMNETEVWNIFFISFGILFFIFLFWKEIKCFVFNEEYAKIVGINSIMMNLLLNAMVITIVIIGLNIVGIILMSSLLIAPGVAARQWSNKLHVNVFFAVIIAVISSICGIYVSYYGIYDMHLSTGPSIAIILSLIVFISLLFASKHGIINKKIKMAKYRKKIYFFKQLIHLYNDEKNLNKFNVNDIDDIFFIKEYLFLENNKLKFTYKGRKVINQLMEGKY